VVRSVPRLRAQFRQDRRRARLPGPLPDRTLDAIGQQLAVSAEIDETLQPELAATATASAAVPGKLSAASCAFVRSARTCMPTAWVTTVP
jgi:hypothetical protein